MLALAIIATITALLAVAISGHRSPLRYIGAGITTFLVTIAFGYFTLPTVGLRFVETWILTLLGGLIGSVWSLGKDRFDDIEFPKGLSVPAGILIALFLMAFVNSSCVRSEAHRNVIGKVEVRQRFTENVPLADTKHIRLVSQETAHTIAKKALGQNSDGKSLGSLFSVDFEHGAVQEVRGELWWIFPLDFATDFVSIKGNIIPGYVRVSAQDPNREATLITEDANGKKFAIKYTPEAVFSDNMDRKVYDAMPWANRSDITFEVDENWHPYYTYSVMTPTIGFFGEQTIGVIIADPETGTCEYKPNGTIPSWIDRVRPMAQAKQQIKDWGELVHGYINMDDRDRVKPAGDLWLVKLGTKLYWSVGITSNNAKDDSILGLMLIDSRMGVAGAEYYPMKGTTEDGAMKAVNSQLGANATTWCATHPTPYNIFGKATWVIPVVSKEQSFFQKVALVSMENVNTLVIESDLTTALESYRQKLATDGNAVAASGTPLAKKTLGPVRITRTGDTVVGGNKTFFFTLEGVNSKLFTTRGTDEAVRVAPVLHVGDIVTVTFLENDEAVIALDSIKCQGLALTKTKVQESFDAEHKASKEADAIIKDAREATNQMENLTDAEKQKMLQLLREHKK